MTTRNRYNSRIPVENRSLPRKSEWLFIGALLAVISIACICPILPLAPMTASGNPVPGEAEQPAIAAPSVPLKPPVAAPTGPGFTAADCTVPGVTFPPPSFGYEVDDLHNGPYVYCSLSHEGAHGLSEDAYIGIMTLQPDKLDGAYEQAFDGIQGFLDQAQERNAIPDIPADARDEISLIQDDDDGLVFMITSQSNVYNCLLGAGHGAEKVNGKYLVITQYESCELGDAASYTDRLKSLQAAARSAIERVEAAAQ
jgi:hypothetical protein